MFLIFFSEFIVFFDEFIAQKGYDLKNYDASDGAKIMAQKNYDFQFVSKTSQVWSANKLTCEIY